MTIQTQTPRSNIRRFGWSDLYTAASLTLTQLLFPAPGGMPNGLD